VDTLLLLFYDDVVAIVVTAAVVAAGVTAACCYSCVLAVFINIAAVATFAAPDVANVVDA